MNDAERDAWLREALRHAPDIDALPPSDVSESILLQARAAARATPPAGRRSASRAAPASAFAAFWAWLARPPVAGAFATIMAATLVGLMWWDRPMDETRVRTPAPASDRRVDTTAPLASTTLPAAPSLGAATAPRQAATSADPASTEQGVRAQLSARDAKLAAAAKPRAEPHAKERSLPVAPKSEAPAPFPSVDAQRKTRSVANSLDAANKDAGAAQRASADESRSAPAANRADGDALPRADIARAGATAPALASGRVQAQSEAPQRQRLVGEDREKAAGFAAAAPAPFRAELTPARPDASARSATPPATVLGAIAADPTQWSRRAAGGDSFALDAGWRTWLSDLDAAAAGQWRALDAGAASEAGADRDAATTLRLVAGGTVAAVIRLEGTTAQVELPSGAGRWQATLSAEAAERLRASARRQSR